MESSSCHWKCHRKNLATSPGSLRRVGGHWEDGVDEDKLVWELVRGTREGARVHTNTRAYTVVHTHTRTRRCGSPRPADQGPRICSPPLVMALAGWGGDQEAVTRATSAAVAFQSAAGPSLLRARIRPNCVQPTQWRLGAVSEPPLYPWAGSRWGRSAVGGDAED